MQVGFVSFFKYINVVHLLMFLCKCTYILFFKCNYAKQSVYRVLDITGRQAARRQAYRRQAAGRQAARPDDLRARN